MKTQIANLINGSKNVVRTKSAKYADAKLASSHNGFAGTSSEERMEIAEKVFAENGDTMHIVFDGADLQLSRHTSTSGKSVTYTSEISEELAAKYVNTDGNCRHYSLTIEPDCTVRITKMVRKNERCSYKLSQYIYVDEALVSIL